MADIPDPEDDFAGFVEGAANAMLEEITAIPESERTEWFLMRAAQRLYHYKKIDAPTFLIEMQKRRLQRLLAKLPVYCADYEEPDSAGEKRAD